MSMLRAALPYTAGNQRHALEMLLQVDTLINTARRGAENDLEACAAEAKPEEMLLHIQEYCTPRESDLVQMILNFIKANHLFQNYREFMASQPENHLSGDIHATGYSKNTGSNPLNMLFQLFGGLGGTGNSSHFMEFLISQLPPEQKQLFEQLQNLSAAGMFTQSPDSFASPDNGQTYSDTFSSTENSPEYSDGFSSSDNSQTYSDHYTSAENSQAYPDSFSPTGSN